MEWTDLPLVLGTVQLGMPYGIANRRGQPDYQEARAILATAYECGITWLDTAAAYGESEAVLGRALRELSLTGRMRIATKIPDLAGIPAESVPARIEGVLTQSMARLGIDRLPVVLFHREADARYLEAVLTLQERGLVEQVGVSLMTPQALAELLPDERVQAVQLAASALDRRFSRAGLLDLAAQRGVAVFARSVYLQGLLLMAAEEVPPHLQEILPVRRSLEVLAAEAGMSLGELALRFVLAEGGVTAVVVGAESVEQVRSNAGFARRGPLPADLAAAVRRAVPDLSEDLIIPHLWARHA